MIQQNVKLNIQDIAPKQSFPREKCTVSKYLIIQWSELVLQVLNSCGFTLSRKNFCPRNTEAWNSYVISQLVP